MIIDIRTIILIIWCANILQLLALYYQYRSSKKYSGPGWWVLWSVFQLAGFSIVLVKLFTPLSSIFTILQHLFIITGFLCLLTGISKFTLARIHIKTGIIFSAVYLLVLAYLIYLYDSGSGRIGLINISAGVVFCITAYILIRNKKNGKSRSADFTSGVLILQGLIYFSIGIYNVFFVEDNHLFTQNTPNSLQFLNMLSSGLLLTFGLTMMVTRRLESDLTESAEHFRIIFETNPDPVTITTIEDSIIIDVNEAFIKESGFSRDEIIGKSTIELNLWSNLKTRGEIIDSLKNKGYINNIEINFYNKNGEFNNGLLSSRTIRLNGKPYILSVIRNITDLKNKEEILRESNERFRIAFDNANIGMCLVDTKGVLLKVNDTMSRILGYTKDELEGRDVFSLTRQDYLEVSSSFISNAVERGKDHTEFEKTYVHKDGRDIHAMVSSSLVRNSAGSPIYFVTHIADITERKKAQEELTEEKDRYKLLTENMTDVVWTLDPETLMFNYVSPSVEKLRGYTPEEVMAEPMDAALTPEGSRYVREIIKQRVKNLLAGKESYGEYFRDEIPQPCKDGSNVWTEVITSYYFNDKTGKVEIHGVTRDITERKKAEEEIKSKNEELQKSNDEKDRFFSIIAHDLKSPFNGFLGLTEMMVNSHIEFKPEEIQRISKNLNDSANNLYSLLNNLLEWSKIQGGITEYNPVKINLKDLVESGLSLFRETAGMKNIVLSGRVPPEINVLADRFMLDTVIRNLLSNAIKFGKKGGWVSVYAQDTEEEVSVSVKDAGIGMDKGLIADLFKTDKKVSRMGTDNEPGTGLGLILCKEYVEKNGGYIRADSEVGRGSVFTFTLKKA